MIPLAAAVLVTLSCDCVVVLAVAPPAMLTGVALPTFWKDTTGATVFVAGPTVGVRDVVDCEKLWVTGGAGTNGNAVAFGQTPPAAQTVLPEPDGPTVGAPGPITACVVKESTAPVTFMVPPATPPVA